MKAITKCVVGAGLVAAVIVLAGAAEAGSYEHAYGSGYGTAGHGASGYGVAAGGCYGTTDYARTGHGTASRYAAPASAYRISTSHERWDDRSYGRTAARSYDSYADRRGRPSYDDGCTALSLPSHRDRYDDGYDSAGRSRFDRHDVPKLGSAWPGTSLPSAIRRR